MKRLTNRRIEKAKTSDLKHLNMTILPKSQCSDSDDFFSCVIPQSVFISFRCCMISLSLFKVNSVRVNYHHVYLQLCLKHLHIPEFKQSLDGTLFVKNNSICYAPCYFFLNFSVRNSRVSAA